MSNAYPLWELSRLSKHSKACPHYINPKARRHLGTALAFTIQDTACWCTLCHPASHHLGLHNVPCQQSLLPVNTFSLCLHQACCFFCKTKGIPNAASIDILWRMRRKKCPQVQDMVLATLPPRLQTMPQKKENNQAWQTKRTSSSHKLKCVEYSAAAILEDASTNL